MIKLFFILFFLILIACASSKKRDAFKEIDEIREQAINYEKNSTRLNLKLEELQNQLSVFSEELEENRSLLKNLKKSQKSRISNGEDPDKEELVKPDLQPKTTKTLFQEKKSTQKASHEQTSEEVKEIPQKMEASEKTAEELYSTAYNFYEKKELDKALLFFDSFLKKYPKHNFIDNVYYWLGECYYDKNEFLLAISYFQTVVSKYPNKPKAPDALLKIALSHKEIGSKANALKYLNKLTKDYPGSEAAKKAKDFLPKIK